MIFSGGLLEATVDKPFQIKIGLMLTQKCFLIYYINEKNSDTHKYTTNKYKNCIAINSIKQNPSDIYYI